MCVRGVLKQNNKYYKEKELQMNYKLQKREITTEYGTEIVVEKKYNLNKDQGKNRLWVFQPQDPTFIALNNKMKGAGLWA
jgi:hypothetical protein